MFHDIGKLITIRLHDSFNVNDKFRGFYKIKCSPHNISGQNGLSRSRRVMEQINIVDASVREDREVMPVIVLALVTVAVGSEFYAPFFIVAPMIEVKKNSHTYRTLHINLTELAKEDGCAKLFKQKILFVRYAEYQY